MIGTDAREGGRRHPPFCERILGRGAETVTLETRFCAYAPAFRKREIKAVDRPRPARRGRGHAQNLRTKSNNSLDSRLIYLT